MADLERAAEASACSALRMDCSYGPLLVAHCLVLPKVASVDSATLPFVCADVDHQFFSNRWHESHFPTTFGNITCQPHSRASVGNINGQLHAD